MIVYCKIHICAFNLFPPAQKGQRPWDYMALCVCVGCISYLQPYSILSKGLCVCVCWRTHFWSCFLDCILHGVRAIAREYIRVVLDRYSCVAIVMRFCVNVCWFFFKYNYYVNWTIQMRYSCNYSIKKNIVNTLLSTPCSTDEQRAKESYLNKRLNSLQIESSSHAGGGAHIVVQPNGLRCAYAFARRMHTPSAAHYYRPHASCVRWCAVHTHTHTRASTWTLGAQSLYIWGAWCICIMARQTFNPTTTTTFSFPLHETLRCDVVVFAMGMLRAPCLFYLFVFGRDATIRLHGSSRSHTAWRSLARAQRAMTRRCLTEFDGDRWIPRRPSTTTTYTYIYIYRECV